MWAARKQTTRKLGRPRGFDGEAALEAAMHVFWKKGYEGATLSNLTDAIGMSRSRTSGPPFKRFSYCLIEWATLYKSRDSFHQLIEARVGAQKIEHRIHLQIVQPGKAFYASLLKILQG